MFPEMFVGVWTSEKFGVRELLPQKIFNFDPFVNCIVVIVVNP